MLLYKYKPWNKFTEDIIVNNRIFLPNKRQLNDPAELTHPISFANNFWDSSIQDAKDRLGTKYYPYLFKFGGICRSEEFRRNYNLHPGEINEVYKKYMHLGDHAVMGYEYVYDEMEDTFEALVTYAMCQAEDYSLLYAREKTIGRLNNKLENLGVLSLSQNNKSLVMWANYADNHKGVMLIFDCSVDPLLSKFKKVVYVEERPKIIVNNIDSAILTKHEDWQYEKEYRVVTKIGSRLFNIQPSALKGIILGERMTMRARKYIIKLLQNQKKEIKLYQAKTSLSSYVADYFEIQF
ncbi:DUF2971 domain-containing protein [Mucilaginibacter sp. AW1-7]|uniref:DUF2971 domain-containing protein n=1 Tax=Mucilaginibacter sp. AW1-7 TaxID=3349874 RepID=UPI003F739456